MRRNNSISKRWSSPVPLPDSPSKVPGQSPVTPVDGAAPSQAGSPEPKPTPEIPLMPAFLQLNSKEIHDSFMELARLENERIAEKFKNPSMDAQWARLDPDPTRDRYVNVHPWANNRVHLKVPKGYNDYINASPITLVPTSGVQGQARTGSQHKYICMQGPKRETVDHVWHMVWHELATPAVIIMLSPTHGPHPNVLGAVSEKCFPYFPADEDSSPIVINEASQLGDNFKGTIRFDSREPTPPGTDIEIRKLIMNVEGEDNEKPIWHFLYPSWPDFGALEAKNVDSIISLMSMSREKNSNAENPRIVHCSAGVGRTGTFVALEFLIAELQGGAWERWDKSDSSDKDPVFDTVNQLRTQRRTMVQSYEQYVFIYEVLRKVWEEKYGTRQVEGGDHQRPRTAGNIGSSTSRPPTPGIPEIKLAVPRNSRGSGKSTGGG